MKSLHVADILTVTVFVSDKDCHFCNDCIVFVCFFQSVVENKNVELRVKVKAGPDVKVIWFHNGKEMVQSPRVKVSKVNDVHTLMLVQVTQKMTGSYSVVASNRHGKVEHVAQITVTG